MSPHRLNRENSFEKCVKFFFNETGCNNKTELTKA